MRVLVTGAAGQLGSDCVRVLTPDHEVSGFSSRQLDITDPGRVREVMDEVAPEVVINCAAYTAVDRCEEEEARCLAVNGEGPATMARECARTGARLIHISTDYVFSGERPAPEPYREEDPVSPLSAYGRAKLAGEQEVARESANHLILRTAWLFGIDGHNFLKTILRLTLADPGRTLRVVDDQTGSLTWTATLARQIALLMDSGLTGIVHATAQGHCTWYRGACHFLTVMGVEHVLAPCTTADYPTPAHRPANSILDNARLRAAGLDQMRSWQQDVEEFARQHRDRLLREARAALARE